MTNSNTPIEVYPAVCNLKAAIGKDKPFNAAHSTSTYGIVTQFSNNKIQISHPMHFNVSDHTNNYNADVPKLIIKNIEEEFKRLQQSRNK